MRVSTSLAGVPAFSVVFMSVLLLATFDIRADVESSAAVDGRWLEGFGLESDCNGSIHDIVEATDGMIYVGGDFTRCGTTEAFRVARFDPASQTWSSLDGALGNGASDTVRAIAVSKEAVYIGGSFLQVDCEQAWECSGSAALHVARWDGEQWHAVGSSGSNGVDGPVRTLLADGNELFLGGAFDRVHCPDPMSCDDVNSRGIVLWDGTQWHPLADGVDGSVAAIEARGDDLYVAGFFNTLGDGQPITPWSIARWNRSGKGWHSLSDGLQVSLSGSISDLVLVDDELVMVGAFSVSPPSGPEFFGLARVDLDSGEWSGANLPVPFAQPTALSHLGDALYVGGFGPEPANLVRWFNQQWTQLGSNLSGFVYALQTDADDRLIVMGQFFSAGNQASRNLAVYQTRGTLTVNVSGETDDRVVSNPAGIDCPGSCSASFKWDQEVTLQALASPGQALQVWSEPACESEPVRSVFLLQDLEVEAVFDRSPLIFRDRFQNPN